MCGIAGILNFNNKKVVNVDIKKMTDSISHRGPDGEGQWINKTENIGLGHRRLAIIDLSDKAKQPMHFADRYTIILNGEIYNYIELKEELLAKDYKFISSSDTEVLIIAYHEYKENVLEKLDGMFAFAIWDEQEKKLFCARDRFGEKPFYYKYIADKYFIFASEMKSLFAFGIPKTINNKMLFYYLAYDVVENPFDKSETFYNDIKKLEAAHYLIIDYNGNLTKKRYWKINPDSIQNSITPQEATDTFKELFYESTKRRLRSDVAVGSSLSGGLDSSSVVVAINSILHNPDKIQKTFSARFTDPSLDEGKYITILQKQFNLQSYYTFPDENNLTDEIDKIFYHQEEPFGSASIIAQWDVMKLAKNENTTVLLDGQGGDEILAGYHKYFNSYIRELFLNDKKQFNREKYAIENLHSWYLQKSVRFLLEAYTPDVLRCLGKFKRLFYGNNYFGELNPGFVEPFIKLPPPFRNFNSLNQELYYDTTIYGLEKLLRFADRNSMAFSREIRLPFLYHKLVEFIFSLQSTYKISQGWTKYILRKSMEGLLPEEITWRVDKIGFQPPQDKWFDNPKINELLNESKAMLIEKQIIKEESGIDDWKALMVAKLFEVNYNL